MRLRTITMAAACVLAAGLAKPAAAQDYPNQSIKMIISFGAGGGSDIVGRIIAQRMQEKLGQPVVVENRPGAGGLLGNEAVASAPKDGYTLGVQTAGQIITPVMTKVVRFQPVDSFEWIGEIAVAGLLVVVRPDYPYKDIKSLVAAAKAEPGKIVFGSPGFGATQHLAAELFKQVAGVNMLHVPYRTTPEATTALLSKNTDVLFDTVTALLGQVQSGQLRALAVTSKDRDPAAPDVPTVVESGVVPNYDVTTWYGLYGPKGMPKPVVAKLNKVLNEILAEPETKSRLTKTGVIVKGSTPEAWAEFVAAEYKKWSAVREKAGLEQR
ncbi:Bug family tripartite tricarboxylate transporter substrate binding protein [Rhodoplanes sp. Z2-YC6860]|uniref:Bug family tripartite tricarboxylate transporter substrate binding protein n=1 Tax=Rhodoplanes sp. Z2-YC6860 TaxID=674703 RepID=UPI00078EC8F5|nr:tripartite tricarboxylate transporter substrate binding protein [Rhodoplanes sp. Z2-YC6860]AMN40827.1 extra-cytoplasmic solute receptor [Rhodoplanes sp. Z2-YC6860]